MYPENMCVQTDIQWNVTVRHPDGTKALLTVRDCTSWQRVTAIAHARYFANHNPLTIVYVRPVAFCP